MGKVLATWLTGCLRKKKRPLSLFWGSEKWGSSWRAGRGFEENKELSRLRIWSYLTKLPYWGTSISYLPYLCSTIRYTNRSCSARRRRAAFSKKTKKRERQIVVYFILTKVSNFFYFLSLLLLLSSTSSCFLWRDARQAGGDFWYLRIKNRFPEVK